MLHGRQAEIAAIDELIARAHGGEGGALVLRGEAGAGKTALLDRAASGAGAMRVLEAVGVEAESDLAFAALHQLLRPVTGLLDALPGPQRAAVRGALGLAASGDRFLLGAGVLSLLAEAAAPDGLVCVVDDFQWVDRASADALLFAARRLGTERVALLLTVRGDAPVKGVPSLDVGGLPEEAAAGLLDALAGGTIAAGVRQRLVTLTAGNPLALRETVRRLSPDQLGGREPLPDPLPGGSRLFGERVAALPAPVRRLALLAALEGDLGTVLRASGSAGRPALDELEAAGLAHVTGTSVRFHHPLVRSAVHESATPAARRTAHAELAAATEPQAHDTGAADTAATDREAPDTGAFADRRAWHLAGAALGPDEFVAAELARAAARARDRGGYGAAAVGLARAADLTPAPLTRAGRLKDAAVSAWLGGLPGRAQSLLAEARRHAGGDAALESQIAQLRGRFELNSGDASEAVRILSAGSGAAARSADGLALLADASEAAAYVGDTAALIEIGRRAEAYPEGFLRDAVAGVGAVPAGREDGPGLLRRALARTGELRDAAEFLWASAAASQLGEADLSAELIGRAGRVARVSGMTGQLPVVLEYVATAERIAGRLAESQAVSEEGLELAREAGYVNTVAAHQANLAAVAALRGQEEICRRHAHEALAIALPHRVGLRAGTAAYALGMLDLGLGRFDAAHDRFCALVNAGPGAGHPSVVWRSTPDRIEAAVGAGDLNGARTALEAYERWSAHAATAESRALLARCRALVAPPDGEEAIEGFAEALRSHTNPYEAARTALLLGERLRRAHRPGEARARLRTALETFRQAGAEPWARRAHAELRAAGESAEAPAGSVLDLLTPQELRIAGLVADGLSSKEIAARLFLSPRTVEYHLYKIYPKLGIGTRTELARLVVLRKAP
ncbi:regulatory protein, luxR family [Nonomuraea maritima]|uniref:Regulatory protein, luxR family n=1 Tax=Nonomuraea maritima TaxID=683260 RepID=A0A1G9FUF8_9ACTN|nr:helix-turn-helix transcriptional regulator [Nonomuraea maritima]SDK92051.1 regulatory protein, luxR family [Nonomuraea maritima]